MFLINKYQFPQVLYQGHFFKLLDKEHCLLMFYCNFKKVFELGYSGISKLYLDFRDSGTNLPPRKWNLPLNFCAQSFGAVNEINESG